MDSSDEMEQEDDQFKPRLNMKHGFIHHIRRNQIDRDNYDKKVKSQPKQYHRRKPTSEKKPESRLYIPPSRNEEGENDEVEGRKSRKVGGKPLFKLEYSTVDGTIHSLLVRKGQDPAKLARRLANQANIPQDLLDTLEWKIEQEQIKRS